MTIYKTVYRNDVASVHIVAAVVKILSFALSLVVYLICLKKGSVTSGLLFTFWFLEAILGVITFRSVLSTPYVTGEEKITPFTNYVVQYPLILASFFLSFWADPKPKYIDLDGKYFTWHVLPDNLIGHQQNPRIPSGVRHMGFADQSNVKCLKQFGSIIDFLLLLLDEATNLTPEKYASFPSRLVFAWFDTLAMKGWKRLLTYSDLWTLTKENRCASIFLDNNCGVMSSTSLLF
jgi:hypothetical protein